MAVVIIAILLITSIAQIVSIYKKQSLIREQEQKIDELNSQVDFYQNHKDYPDDYYEIKGENA